jgi:hypothetical protein
MFCETEMHNNQSFFKYCSPVDFFNKKETAYARMRQLWANGRHMRIALDNKINPHKPTRIVRYFKNELYDETYDYILVYEDLLKTDPTVYYTGIVTFSIQKVDDPKD